MAQLHAQESPDRVRELEQWGALFDRTRDGRILQRAFGGHTWKRLAHVGDRTGLEMIRTLQDRGVHQGLDVYMECTITRLFQDGGRIAGALGYWRASGEFVRFRAKAVVLATGGIGKSYLVTSNSWEYTGDGQALAYHAGAELIDMEFVQFHPTGMVWPPGVMGLLVTEGVRGEGGIMRNSKGERFMWRYLPEARRSEYADDEAEARRWVEAALEGRRPPELLTRDHVARCIVREIKEGRGSPHAGVFLDISWIKEKLPNAPEHIKKKLPSMYHQFKQLADVDITTTAMEVGPTMHYIMGGVRVHPETQMSTVPGLFAAGECGAGLHGANRLGGNSLSDLLVFGKRAGKFAAAFAKEHPAGSINTDQVDGIARWALEPFERGTSSTDAQGPYQIQHELQGKMQEVAGIVRTEKEMLTALEEIGKFRKRAREVAVQGNREYNSGWYTALDLPNLLTVSEAITRSALERRESRGGHFREDYPNKEKDFGEFNIIVRRGADGEMKVVRENIPPLPAELKQIIEEQQK